MCYVIKTFFSGCRHYQHQNLFRCPVARISLNPSDLTLVKTKRLPERPEVNQLQDRALACSTRAPVRPRDGICDSCKRQQRQIIHDGGTPVPSRNFRRLYLSQSLSESRLHSRTVATAYSRPAKSSAELPAPKQRTAKKVSADRTSKVLAKEPPSLVRNRERAGRTVLSYSEHY
jgi:hypothetical protein